MNNTLLKNQSFKTLLSALPLILFAIWFFIGNRERKKLLSSSEIGYVIVEINSWTPGAKTSSSLVYRFQFEKEEYEGKYSPGYNTYIKDKPGKYNYYIGKKFLAKFSKQKPKYSDLLWHKPVPDSLVECCRYRVWDKPPF